MSPFFIYFALGTAALSVGIVVGMVLAAILSANKPVESEDKQRLDWLEKTRVQLGNGKDSWAVLQGDPMKVVAPPTPTVRGAIDAARQVLQP
jgi:hypothetical protein